MFRLRPAMKVLSLLRHCKTILSRLHRFCFHLYHCGWLRQRLVPLLMSAVFIGITLVLWNQLLRRDRIYMGDRIAAEASLVQMNLKNQVQNQVQALERMALRWELRGGTPRIEWEQDARSYVRDFKGYQAIAWVDTAGKMQWMEPLAANESLPQLNLQEALAGWEILERSRQGNRTVLTPAMDWQQGEQAFLVIHPLFLEPRPAQTPLPSVNTAANQMSATLTGTSSGYFNGYLVAIFNATSFFDALINHIHAENYRLTISSGDTVLYQQQHSGHAVASDYAVASRLSLYDQTWTLHFVPTQRFVAQIQSPLPWFVLGSGLLCSILVMAAIENVQMRQRQLRSIRQINQQLSQEVAQRQAIAATQRALIESLPDLMIRMRRDGTYLAVECSPHFSLVKPLETLRTSHIRDVLSPADADYRLQLAARALDTGAMQSYTFALEVQGQPQWQDVRISPIRAEGIHDEVLIIVRDITSQHLAEEALKSSEERWQLAIQGSNTGIWDWDLQQQRVYRSPRWSHVRGYATGELGDDLREWSSRIHPDDSQRVLEAIADHLAQRSEFYEQEYRVQRRDGSYLWILDRGRALWDESGNAIRMVGSETDISDRKQAEVTRQALFDALPDFMVRMALDGTQLEVLNAGTVHDMAPENSATRINIRDFMRPDLAETRITLAQRAVETQTIQAHEYQFRGDDHQLRYEEARIVPLNGDEVLVVVRDITQRVETEQALRASEATKQALISAMPDFLVRVNRDGRYLEVMNRENTNIDIWNYDANFSGSHITQALPPHLASERLSHIHKTLETQTIQLYEYQIEVNGITYDEECRIIPLNADSVLTVVRDITERKHSEHALQYQLHRALLLQKITHAIRQNLDIHQMFEVAARQIGEAFQVNCCMIHVYEPKTAVNVASDAPATTPATAPEVAHSSASECFRLVGCYPHDWGSCESSPITANLPTPSSAPSVPPSIAPSSNAFPYLQAAIRQEQAIAIDDVTAHSPLSFVAAPPDSHPVRSLLAIGTFYQGIPNGTICLHQCDRQRQWTQENTELIQDLAAQMGIAIAQANLIEQEVARRQELLQKNIALTAAKREAEAANRAKSEFLTNMSHEIRTPMNAVLGFTDLLQPLMSDPVTQGYLEAIASSGKTLLALINDILDLSKIEAGRLEIQLEPLHLAQLIRDIQHIFTQKAIAKGIQLRVSLDSQIPDAVLFDDVRLRQILFNVVGNAIKFTDTGEVAIEVTCSYPDEPVSPETVCLDITVRDTGIGIAIEDQQHIFEAFTQSQGQSNRKFGGTGLGLAITSRLVEQMGGTIRLDSTAGEGSTFSFLFPAVAIATASAPIAQPDPQTHTLSLSDPATLLIVDDVESNRLMLAEYFRGTPHKLLFAVNGQEAVHLATHCRPDCILMDLRMPELDGREATHHLKQNAVTATIPIIIITASSQPYDTADIQPLCQGFLRKPVSRQDLMNAVQSCMSASSAQGQRQASAHFDVSYLTIKNKLSSEPSPPVMGQSISEPISPALSSSASSATAVHDLAVHLREIFDESWESLRHTLIFDELEQFILQLQDVNHRFPHPQLQAYLQTLMQQFRDFDWAQLPQTVDQFQDILTAIEQQSSASNPPNRPFS